MSFFDSINMLTTALEGPGVYQIMNTATGMRYVGSTQCLRKRRNSHWHALQQGKHANKHLQAAWDVNQSNLQFKILFTCPQPLLRFFEQNVLDAFTNLYNINSDAATCKGRKFSEASKEKMRQAKLGATLPAEQKAKISASLKGRPKKPFSVEHRANLSAARKRFLDG